MVELISIQIKKCFFCSDDGAFEEVKLCPETSSLAFRVCRSIFATGEPVIFLKNVSFHLHVSSVGVDPVSPTQIAASIWYNIGAIWEEVSS